MVPLQDSDVQPTDVQQNGLNTGSQERLSELRDPVKDNNTETESG